MRTITSFWTFTILCVIQYVNSQDTTNTACSGSITITAEADLPQISGCTSIAGDLVFKSMSMTSSAGAQSTSYPEINLASIHNISGNLEFTSLESWNSQLSITKDLKDLTVGGAVSFSKIAPSFDAKILLASAASVSFSDANIESLVAFGAEQLAISEFLVDGTNITSLDLTTSPSLTGGGGSDFVPFPYVNITNNPQLTSLTTGMGGTTYNYILKVAGNDPSLGVQINDQPSSVELSGCDSVSALGAIYWQTAIFTDNSFSSLELPSLGAVDTNFTIDRNENLETLSLPDLLFAYSFSIQDNDVLKEIDLPELHRVNTSFDIFGDVTSVSFPSLTLAPSVNITSYDSVDCSELQSIQDQKHIANQSFICTHLARPVSSAASTSGKPHARSGALTTEEKLGIGIGVGVGGLVVFGALAFWMLRRRRRQIARKEENDAKQKSEDLELDGTERSELAGEQKHELASQHLVAELKQPETELPAYEEAHELGSQHGVTELPTDER